MSAPSSSTAPVDIARSAADALDAGDLDRYDELVHDDAVFEILPFGEQHGRVAVRGFFEEVRSAMPNFSLTTEAVTGDDRRAAVEWRIRGTFNGGPFQGLTPNGREFDLRGIDFMEVDSGRIRHDRTAFDGAEWARQLGLLPQRGSATENAVVTAFNLKTQAMEWWQERTHARHHDGHR
ncbi:ester cyclase [Kitasatospora sp. RB6PN24]|uniref:ester cyclase n=1 Tax=Kitasatospora humi TaxID=2893891 RepID=UPI001E594F19|nr:ester cyclase [Kitasatospora humi]MCC9307804.1 ester cyclase [Kitasatospora humi]